MKATSHPFQPAPSAREYRREAVNLLVIVLASACLLFVVAMLVCLIGFVLLQCIRYINLDLFT